MKHHDCKFEKALVPHCVHLAVGVATLVLAAKTLCKLHHIHRALKDFRRGEEELEKASPALAHHHEEKAEKKK
ncbi:MAG: hypothetical protein K2M67_03275 [Muribaculaceae bacterium]|nr:hypothetical protein [Bacteroides sp.]MDE7495849.1 hypothetical protein [Muribaculaceae bacterium]